MNTDFNSIAKSRAKYYLKGSPVQFVWVELLKPETQQSVAVTLTFKNIAPAMLEELNILFSCKDKSGQIVAQDKFSYKQLQVGKGQFFGADDAVFVSNMPLSNVEVKIVSAVYSGKLHNLTNCQIIPLPALRDLGIQSKQMLDNVLNINWSRYVPCNVQDGWVCTCGAFNYNTGDALNVCGECGIEKLGLFNNAKAILNREAGAEQQNAYQQNAQGQYSEFNALQNENMQSDKLETVDFENLLSPEDITYSGMSDELEAESARYTDSEQYKQNNVEQNSKKSNKPYLMSNATADTIIKFTPLVTLGLLATYFIIIIIMNMLLF